jgi:hypothetical protein
MLKNIFNGLRLDIKHDSELIAIAKGKYKLPETFLEAFEPLKKIKWLRILK